MQTPRGFPGPVAALVAAFVVALAGCGRLLDPPATPTPPAPTPPPGLADVEPWPELHWRGVDVPLEGDLIGRRLAALATGPVGIVAVGFDDRGGREDGLVLHAPDGVSLEVVDDSDLAGFGLEDVAADDAGYVAIGTELEPPAGGPARVVVAVSADGRDWRRLAADPMFAGALAGRVAAGPGGFLATGTTDGSDQRLWRSFDGRTWSAVTGADVGLAGVTIASIEADAQGWLVSGVAEGRPIVARSVDGRHWDVATLPGSGERDRTTPWVERVVGGPASLLASGAEGDDCGFLWIEGDCAASRVTWWSDGAGAWTALHPATWPSAHPGALLAAAGDRGFVAIDGHGAATSGDGLTWADLPAPADDRVGIRDVLVVDDRIYAVGEAGLASADIIGWLGIAAPEGAGPRLIAP